jgi:glutathione synthase/RimK-type ligase-like ATP-grasp enzyme
LECVDSEGRIVVKPVNGARGKNVKIVEKIEGEYYINQEPISQKEFEKFDV